MSLPGFDEDIETLDLSTRAERALREEGCKTVLDIYQYLASHNGKAHAALMRIPNIGRHTVREIELVMAPYFSHQNENDFLEWCRTHRGFVEYCREHYDALNSLRP